MNMHSSMVAEGEAPADPLWDADVFRSRLIGKIAEAERWAVERLTAADPAARIPCLVGKRIEALRDCARDHPEVFRKAGAVPALLDRLKPFVELRSALAHSTLAILHHEGRPDSLAVFEHAMKRGIAGSPARILLDGTDMRAIWNEASNLVNQLRQHSPLAATPCAPPRPAPAAAAGP
jgi:hypothetical protein